MKNYEVTFIVDPVLSGEEIKATAQTYIDHLKGEGCSIVHNDEMGLRQLAYAIKKRTSGVFYSVEFTSPNGDMIPKLELALRRDERIMRFLTIKLDKHGVKYNEDKRNGLIGSKRDKKEESKKEETKPQRSQKPAPKAKAPAPKTTTAAPVAPKAEAPAPETTTVAPVAPKAEAPAPETTTVAPVAPKAEEE